MKEDKNIKIFSILVLIITVITLLLSIFYNNAFIPSFMLMLALFIFSIAYSFKQEKRLVVYILFIVGVLLIIGSLLYTFMRII